MIGERATFGTRLGTILTLVGVAIGLGNVWRFPYMAGRFGGAVFVLLYLVFVAAIGVPALMAEWSLGRRTRRGPVGAFEAAGLPGGRLVGWLFFGGVAAATAYYVNVIGWVGHHGLEQVARGLGVEYDASAALPPESGIEPGALLWQLASTVTLVAAAAWVLSRGVRDGIERASRLVVPALLGVLLLLIARSLTLPGAGRGVEWFLLDARLADLDGGVAVAALGQAVFSLSLGGTYMVVYGSYLDAEEDLTTSAVWTALGDTGAGLLAGLAVLPAVVALGLEPGSGPELVFSTLPRVFGELPAGWFFGTLFFGGLAGAAFLSGLGAFEVLVAGLTDNTALERGPAVRRVAAAVLVLSLPSMLSMAVFVPWDLTFGSGLQTGGALLAALTVGWSFSRAEALEEMSRGGDRPVPRWLYWWVRLVIPASIAAVGAWWVLTEVGGAL